MSPLGREAALKPASSIRQMYRVRRFASAAQPNGGKPPRHRVATGYYLAEDTLRPAMCFKYPTNNSRSPSGNTFVANAGIFACGH
ncbi:hypothetical protein PMI30_00454 [Pseudomonas sp. GM50]|nr:hypothetical protein PMI30_00454 [Pseudomonas sp. GM50]